MNEREFNRRLAELVSQIGNLPEPQRDGPEKVVGDDTTSCMLRRRAIDRLQDTVDTLRLEVKSLVFDLEATRRENRYLRKLLERQSNRGENGDPDSE